MFNLKLKVMKNSNEPKKSTVKVIEKSNLKFFRGGGPGRIYPI